MERERKLREVEVDNQTDNVRERENSGNLYVFFIFFSLRLFIDV